MFSDDGMKQYIVGVTYAVGKVKTGDTPPLMCEHGSIEMYTPVYEHLDWLQNLIGDERCITNSFQFEPEKVWPHLQAIVLSILSIALIIALTQRELERELEIR